MIPANSFLSLRVLPLKDVAIPGRFRGIKHDFLSLERRGTGVLTIILFPLMGEG
jgi:hypothetical protein